MKTAAANETESHLLTIERAAAKFDLDPKVIRQAVEAGAISHLRLAVYAGSKITHAIRIHPQDLDDWRLRNSVKANWVATPSPETLLPGNRGSEQTGELAPLTALCAPLPSVLTGDSRDSREGRKFSASSASSCSEEIKKPE